METTMTYMVCDGNGNQITDGLQQHEAHRVAKRIANSRGESVWLSENTSPDMGEEIAPEQD